jgi:hypothetical protein
MTACDSGSAASQSGPPIINSVSISGPNDEQAGYCNLHRYREAELVPTTQQLVGVSRFGQ